MYHVLYGAAVLFVFALAALLFSHKINGDRERMRINLTKKLDDLIESVQRHTELTDIMSILDVAELQVRHIEHVSGGIFPSRTYRRKINAIRADAIMTKVQERISVQLNQGRKAQTAVGLLHYVTTAESTLTRWVMHPALSQDQRGVLHRRIKEIETVAQLHPLVGKIRDAVLAEREDRLEEARNGFKEAIAMLRDDEAGTETNLNVLSELSRQLEDVEAKLAATGNTQNVTDEDPTLRESF